MYLRLRAPKLDFDENDVKRIFRSVQAHLKSQGLSPLPHYSTWENQEQSDEVMKLIHDLSVSIRQAQSDITTEQSKIESDLINTKASTEKQVKAFEKKINMQEQELAEIRAEISKIEGEMKEDKRQYLLREKPKLLELRRMEKRRNIRKIVI